MVHFFFMHKPPFSLPGVILRCAQEFSSAPGWARRDCFCGILSFSLRADSGSTAARARIEAEPESPMGAAISPPLQGQNVGELLAVKRVESSFPSGEAVRLNGLSDHLNGAERRCVRIVKTSRDNDVLEHRRSVRTGGQRAVIL